MSIGRSETAWPEDRDAGVCFTLTTQKRAFDLVAETPSQAALWKVWIAVQLLQLGGGAGAGVGKASAAATMWGCLTIEAGRTALTRVVAENPAVRGLLEAIAAKEASAGDGAGPTGGHVTATLRALVSGLGTRYTRLWTIS